MDVLEIDRSAVWALALYAKVSGDRLRLKTPSYSLVTAQSWMVVSLARGMVSKAVLLSVPRGASEASLQLHSATSSQRRRHLRTA
jgi:hypothetical protein